MPRGAAAVLAGLALAASAAAAGPAPLQPPASGVLVPGTSLGGLRLGATRVQVEARWGRAYGVCGSCALETWYFNYYAFQPAGVGVEFRRGRAVALFTIYSPSGWRTPAGVRLGGSIAEVTSRYGALTRQECGGYYALLLPGGGGRLTVFYGLREQVWAFALQRRGLPICR